MTEEKKGEGFVIKDKRFSESSESSAKQEEAKTEERMQQGPPEEPVVDADYPAVNFSNFIISLSTSALFHFGDFPEYEGGKAEKNLPAAKQTIDILDMIHEKTKGNLDANEAGLIQGVLYELKMRYIKEKG